MLTTLSGVEGRVLRRRDLPFGSSVFLAAVKPRRLTPDRSRGSSTSSPTCAAASATTNAHTVRSVGSSPDSSA